MKQFVFLIFLFVTTVAAKNKELNDYIIFANSSMLINAYSRHYQIPEEVIIAKLWTETNNGTKGVGTRGAYFGVKGEGIRTTNSEGEVEFQKFSDFESSLKNFCELLNRKYCDRFEQWQAGNEFEDWESWLMALQVPIHLENQFSYTLCGCYDSSEFNCYLARRENAYMNINFIKNNFK